MTLFKLTVKEHLKLYGNLKLIGSDHKKKCSDINADIMALVRDVGLGAQLNTVRKC